MSFGRRSGHGGHGGHLVLVLVMVVSWWSFHCRGCYFVTTWWLLGVNLVVTWWSFGGHCVVTWLSQWSLRGLLDVKMVTWWSWCLLGGCGGQLVVAVVTSGHFVFAVVTWWSQWAFGDHGDHLLVAVVIVVSCFSFHGRGGHLVLVVITWWSRWSLLMKGRLLGKGI